jgi:hypothetical protein
MMRYGPTDTGKGAADSGAAAAAPGTPAEGADGPLLPVSMLVRVGSKSLEVTAGQYTGGRYALRGSNRESAASFFIISISCSVGFGGTTILRRTC